MLQIPFISYHTPIAIHPSMGWIENKTIWPVSHEAQLDANVCECSSSKDRGKLSMLVVAYNNEGYTSNCHIDT